ncbi:MAG TPA: response regulator [Acidimicrobiales bacterium]|nr:response regulator [Acidimicrobiales bacterium]
MLMPYAADIVEPTIRVLVVDDTDHVRRMLTTMLAVDGFEVVGGASDGQSAIDEVAAAEPDVVVIDYKMPAMDGLETARRIRSQRPDQHVILYTAFADPEVEAAAAEIGVAVCLGKVEGLGALEQEIRRLASQLRE